MRDATQGHILLTFKVSKSFATNYILYIVADAIALFLGLITLVFLDKATLVFNLHVYWVVHKSLILNSDG